MTSTVHFFSHDKGRWMWPVIVFDDSASISPPQGNPIPPRRPVNLTHWGRSRDAAPGAVWSDLMSRIDELVDEP